MLVVILIFTFIVFVISAPYNNYSHSFWAIFFKILEFSIGIEINYIGIRREFDDYKLYPKPIRDNVGFIESIGKFIIRIVMINFSLIIIIYSYSKQQEKIMNKISQENYLKDQNERLKANFNENLKINDKKGNNS